MRVEIFSTDPQRISRKEFVATRIVITVAWLWRTKKKIISDVCSTPPRLKVCALNVLNYPGDSKIVEISRRLIVRPILQNVVGEMRRRQIVNQGRDSRFMLRCNKVLPCRVQLMIRRRSRNARRCYLNCCKVCTSAANDKHSGSNNRLNWPGVSHVPPMLE